MGDRYYLYPTAEGLDLPGSGTGLAEGAAMCLPGELSDTLELPFVLTCAQHALCLAVPKIWNSNQGSHFTSPQYTELLPGASVQTPALAAQVQVSGAQLPDAGSRVFRAGDRVI